MHALTSDQGMGGESDCIILTGFTVAKFINKDAEETGVWSPSREESEMGQISQNRGAEECNACRAISFLPIARTVTDLEVTWPS